MLIKNKVVTNFAAVIAALNAGYTHLTIASATSPLTTPSHGFIAETVRHAHEHGAAVDVLIAAPKPDYIYNDSEIKIMEADVFTVQSLGADGVIINALTDKGGLDSSSLVQLIAAAGGMQVSLGWSIDQLAPSQVTVAIKWAHDQKLDHIYSTQHDLSDSLVVPVVASDAADLSDQYRFILEL